MTQQIETSINIEQAIAALRAEGYTVTKRKAKLENGFADYDLSKVKNAKIAFPSPVIAATFEDGEYIRMSFATQVGKPLNVGRAVRVAIDAYTARNRVRQRKNIADDLVDAICGHAHVVSLTDRVEATREKAIEAAEAREAFADSEPEWKAGTANEREDYWKVWGKWSDKRSKLESNADIAVDNYGRAQTALEHAKAEVRDEIVARRMKRVKVPAITYAHIEINGKKVAVLDLEKVNATAKAKVLH